MGPESQNQPVLSDAVIRPTKGTGILAGVANVGARIRLNFEVDNQKNKLNGFDNAQPTWNENG